MYYELYKITNKLNGKYYIGVHKLNKPETDAYYGSGRHIKNAIAKYGKESFEKQCILLTTNKDQAYEWEALIVTKALCSEESCYNIMPGGYGDLTELAKQNVSQSLKAHYANNSSARKHLSELAANRTGDKNGFYGKTHSAEMKIKLSELASARTGENNPFYGKKHTEETIATIRAKNKLAQTGKPKPKSQKYKYATPFGIFDTLAEADKHIEQYTYSQIKRYCYNADKIVGFNYQTPKDMQGEHTYRDLGWYRIKIGN